jgi:uncharacterized protein YukE
MPSVIVTPAELDRFSETLRNRVKEIRSKSRRLQELVQAAKTVWQDEKYSKFQKDLADAARELEDLHRLGEKYAEFLNLKSKSAKKYLARR